MINIVCAGEVMVEFAPVGADGLFHRAFAGDSFNTAVYLARAGLSTSYLTRLGDDAASDGAIDFMQREGVGTTLVGRDAHSSMGLYIIDNDSHGERTFTYYRNASPARRLFDERMELDAAAFYFTGITVAVTRSGLTHLLSLLDALRGIGCQVVFDPNYRPRLWNDVYEARAGLAAVLPYCDMVLPTQDDESALWGLDTAEQSIDFYRERGATEVVIKGDDLLAQAWCETERADRKADPIEAVDTTGAGDAFNAGYLASRLGGASLEDSLSAAQTLAAEVVGHHGAIVPRGEAHQQNRSHGP